MSEFSLIETYMMNGSVKRKDVSVGIGDDCAVVSVAESKQLVVTTDTLVSGVHFAEDVDPKAIAHKALAVNLSDIAAMGAEPCWVSLAITLPNSNEKWLAEFTESFHELSEYYGVQLIGGDTTRGPLSLTITAQGQVPEGEAILRSGAKPGDLIYVTGELGDASLALQHQFGNIDIAACYRESIYRRLEYPTPRVLAGQALRGVASSAIDLSDGLISDLKHILKLSKVGARIELKNLPLSDALMGSVTLEKAHEHALAGGDDYELLFTVNQDKKGIIETALNNSGTPFTLIGQVSNTVEELVFTLDNEVIDLEYAGYDHFQSEQESVDTDDKASTE